MRVRHAGRTGLVAIAAIGLVAACTATPTTSPSPAVTGFTLSSTPNPTPTPTPFPKPPPAPHSTSTPVLLEPPAIPIEPPKANAAISEIGDEQWERIVEAGVWRPECPVDRDGLRRLDVNFVDFDGDIRRGALVANADVIDDLAEIFTELFDAKFPIAQMRPVERFFGEVNDSLTANNTSAFNCRKPGQANAPSTTSPHANGRAIDINPWQNPWMDPRCDCWMPSDQFAEDRTGRGVITEGSLPWQLFTDRGWIWQDIDRPDYMHFDTGFPTRPR